MEEAVVPFAGLGIEAELEAESARPAQLVNGLAPDNPSSLPDLPLILVKQISRLWGFVW